MLNCRRSDLGFLRVEKSLLVILYKRFMFEASRKVTGIDFKVSDASTNRSLLRRFRRYWTLRGVFWPLRHFFRPSHWQIQRQIFKKIPIPLSNIFSFTAFITNFHTLGEFFWFLQRRYKKTVIYLIPKLAYRVKKFRKILLQGNVW